MKIFFRLTKKHPKKCTLANFLTRPSGSDIYIFYFKIKLIRALGGFFVGAGGWVESFRNYKILAPDVTKLTKNPWRINFVHEKINWLWNFETVFRKLFQRFLDRLQCFCGIFYRVFKFYSWNCVRDLYHLFIWVAAAERTSKCCFAPKLWWNTSFCDGKILNFFIYGPFSWLCQYFRSIISIFTIKSVIFKFSLRAIYFWKFLLVFIQLIICQNFSSLCQIDFLLPELLFFMFLCDILRFFFVLASTVSREQSFVRRSFRDK